MMHEGHELQAQDVSDSQFVNEAELRLLLLELEDKGCTLQERDDEATVEAVAEATGHSLDHVENVLARIRAEDIESRLAMRLRELEEPLFRVERPGHAPPDPMAGYFKLKAGESLSPLLDSLKNTDAKPAKRRISRSLERSDIVSRLTGNFVMLFFVAIMVAVVAYGIVQQFR